MKRIFILFVSAAFLFTSCEKKDAEYNSSVKGNLSIEFDNIVGGADLQMNTGTYTNAIGQSFTITKLKYFVSNFVLTNTDGVTYVVPQDSCYFLIDESIAASREPVLKLPEGEYKTLSFTMGVDSLRNTMDISKRTGVLDPLSTASDMYWSWNSGYIFYKIEGNSPVSTGTNNHFEYHIGGFGGYSTATINNLKQITIDLTQRGTPKVKASKETNVHLFVDVLKSLNGSTNISFATANAIHSITGGKPIADNYATMFTHDHTEN